MTINPKADPLNGTDTDMSIFLSYEADSSAGTILGHNIRIIKSRLSDINISDYTPVLGEIGVIVNCYPNELTAKGFGKIRRYISYKNRYADIRLPIDYDKLLKADRREQYILTVKNIIESVQATETRLSAKKLAFDSEKLIRDIMINT